MGRAERRLGRRRGSMTRIPVPIAQRISGLTTGYRTLQLILDDVTEAGYQDALRSRDPQRLKDIVYPLERAFEVASNYTIELVALGLEEVGLVPVDGPRDLRAFCDAGVISRRLRDQLARIHRARNELTHQYPDVLAATIYEAGHEQIRAIPAFLRAYATWLTSRGYGVPDADEAGRAQDD